MDLVDVGPVEKLLRRLLVRIKWYRCLSRDVSSVTGVQHVGRHANARWEWKSSIGIG